MLAEVDRARIWQVDAQTGAHRPYATGTRNPTALAIQPGTDQLWAVVNERDELGPDLVPDYLTSVKDGGFYGWPYSYWGQNVDTRVQPQDPQHVAAAIRPDYSLGSHVAALGVAFSAPSMGGKFADGVFVGEHGSWNRQTPVRLQGGLRALQQRPSVGTAGRRADGLHRRRRQDPRPPGGRDGRHQTRRPDRRRRSVQHDLARDRCA